jgi:acetyl/propionyl-CoA carboxylase alpha subunit
MIAKLIAYSATREQAIERLCRAIDEYHIKGVKTTLAFGKWAVQTEQFKSGKFDTKFIDNYYKPSMLANDDEALAGVAATLAAYVWQQEQEAAHTMPSNASISKWKLARK